MVLNLREVYPDISGKIIGFHGKNGVVRVKFDKGVPGQALGTTVELAS